MRRLSLGAVGSKSGRAAAAEANVKNFSVQSTPRKAKDTSKEGAIFKDSDICKSQ